MLSKSTPRIRPATPKIRPSAWKEDVNFLPEECLSKWWVLPPFHTPKWSFLIRKTSSSWVPTILGNTQIEEKNKTFEAQNSPLENGSTINLYHHVPATSGFLFREETARVPTFSF